MASGQPPAKTFPGRQRRLQDKVTALAIALGTLPVLATGSTAYVFASRSIGNQIVKEQIQRAEIIGTKLDNFLVDRQREMESLAANPMFIEKDLRDNLSMAQKHSLLVRFSTALQYFDDIILFDPEGNPIVQTTQGEPFLGNYGDRSYFQAALKTGKTTMNGPGLSPNSGELRVEYAVPVTDAVTGDIVYIIRARVLGKQMNQLVDVFDAEDSTWALLDADGIIFAGSDRRYLAQSVYSYYPELSLPTQGKQAGSNVFNNSWKNGTRQLVSYTSVAFSTNLADRSFGALMIADTAIVFAPQRHLLNIFALGTGIAAVVIGAIAALVANRAIRPIQQVTQVAQQVAQGGNLELRAKVKTQDEIGLLATSLNQLIIWIAEHTHALEQSHSTLEQRVRERTQQLNAIIDNLGDGLLVIDARGTITHCNPTLINMFNLHTQTLVGRPCYQIFNADLSDLIAQNQLEPNQLLSAEVTLAGGGIGQALATAIASDDAGDRFGSIVLIRDITAEKEVDQMKTDFLSTVSHELRTPLTSVLGFAKLIQKKLDDIILPAVNSDTKKIQRTTRQVRENLHIIVSEGERLTSLINDVLDIAKIEAGKIEWMMQSVAVAEIVERAVAAMSVLAQNNGLEIVCDLEPDLPKVICDRNRLIQVVINLLSNAIKFTDRGAITCRVRRQHTHITISIIDTGIGLSPSDLESVFEKFKQVGEIMTDKPEGTGLGLSICKQIVEHHGGQIWAEGQPGQGSTFAFTLPLEASSKPQGAQPHLQSLMQQLKTTVNQAISPTDNVQKTILVVDDDPHIRRLLRQELEAVGYRVQVARDGLDGLKQVKAAPPDLVIIDVMMPNISGLDLVAVLKNNSVTMAIPTIVLSIIQDPEQGHRLGVDRYLSKPIDTDILLRDIKTLLAQGTSNRRLLVVDMDISTNKTLTKVLLSKGYTITESVTGKAGIAKALARKPDMLIVDAAIATPHDLVKTLRFNNGVDTIFIIMVEPA